MTETSPGWNTDPITSENNTNIVFPHCKGNAEDSTLRQLCHAAPYCNFYWKKNTFWLKGYNLHIKRNIVNTLLDILSNTPVTARAALTISLTPLWRCQELYKYFTFLARRWSYRSRPKQRIVFWRVLDCYRKPSSPTMHCSTDTEPAAWRCGSFNLRTDREPKEL